MRKGNKRGLIVSLLLLVLLPILLLGLVRLDRSQATWIEAGDTPLALPTLGSKPLAIEADWKSHPIENRQGYEMRNTTLRLEVPDGRQRTLMVRSNSNISFLSINGRLATVVNKPEGMLGTMITLPAQVGSMVVEVAVSEPSMLRPPLLMLGTERDINTLNTRRIVTAAVLITLLLTGGLVILMNYLWQGRQLHTLALWLAYMLLLLSQVDLFMPQMLEAEVLHQTAMLLLSAALCCAASLRLEGQREGPLLLGLLIVDSLLALLWIGGFVVIKQAPLFALAVPMQCVGFVFTAIFAILGIIQSANDVSSINRSECVALLLQLVGLGADMVLPRSRMLVLVPVMVFSAGMAGVHLWLAARQQAEDRQNSAVWEKELEQRVEMRTEELRLANEQLSRIDASRSEFFSHIAHDLQSPLTIIRGSLDLVIDGMPTSDEERENYLAMAKASTVKLTNRIKALRGLALMEENEYNPHMQKLRPLMTIWVENWRTMYRSNQLVFTAEGEDIAAMCDENWLQNAMERLVSNAVRYTPPGGRVDVTWQRVQFGTQICVADTGCGIAEKDLPTLFDKFYQGWNSRDGLGIGLAAVQRVVQRHGGRVSAESKPGEGSRFTMFFPDISANTWVATPHTAQQATEDAKASS